MGFPVWKANTSSRDHFRHAFLAWGELAVVMVGCSGVVWTRGRIEFCWFVAAVTAIFTVEKPRLSALWREAKDSIKWVDLAAVVLLLAMTAIYVCARFWRARPPVDPVFLVYSKVGYLGAVYLQEYALQKVIFERSRRFLNPLVDSTLAALLFSALHAPNPILMTVTLAGGFLFCEIYRRAENLPLVAVVHWLLATTLLSGFRVDLHVGPGYWR